MVDETVLRQVSGRLLWMFPVNIVKSVLLTQYVLIQHGRCVIFVTDKVVKQNGLRFLPQALSHKQFLVE